MDRPIRSKSYSTPISWADAKVGVGHQEYQEWRYGKKLPQLRKGKKKKQAPLKPATVVSHKKLGSGVVLKRIAPPKQLTEKNPNKDWSRYKVQFISKKDWVIVRRCRLKVVTPSRPNRKIRTREDWLEATKDPPTSIKQDLSGTVIFKPIKRTE